MGEGVTYSSPTQVMTSDCLAKDRFLASWPLALRGDNVRWLVTRTYKGVGRFRLGPTRSHWDTKDEENSNVRRAEKKSAIKLREEDGGRMGDPCWKKNGRQNNYDMMSLRKKETLTLLDRLRLFLGYNPLAHADQRRMGPGVACRQVVIMAVENRRNIVWTLYVVEDEKLCFNFIAMMLSTNDRILMGVEKSKKKKSGKRGDN
ncbi:hypothetical protein RRG08_049989 [Elysia crispata]|uniref:Uncharacterized protein n=1 Tax=Elysia crispata TaxID=231223 RepID=A0AAE1B9W5_9GAST|nr:hypothetical protein RRG08_049989 [Elysia crispata]